jgi:membrane fusion protein (multidrug efflux system)
MRVLCDAEGRSSAEVRDRLPTAPVGACSVARGERSALVETGPMGRLNSAAKLSERYRPMRAVLVLCASLLVACDGGTKPKPSTASPPPPVKTLAARAETIPVTNEYVGRVAAYRSLEIRARVEGIVARRHFVEGSKVVEGELLYTLDAAPFDVALADAKAELARAEAVVVNARSRESRYRPLVKETAISQQDYDDAVAALAQAEAQRAAALARIERAEIDLGYTRIHTTQAGRIGAALVPEGRLVGKGEATHLATVERIDRVYVTFTVADSEAMALRNALDSGTIRAQTGGSTARILLPDGAVHEEPGLLDFTDLRVDSGTGTMSLRAVMENPREILLPGLFVRVLLTVGQRPDAVLVPQKAIMKMPSGHSVFVVDETGTAERRDLVLGAWHGEDWVVEGGLAAGEQVIVDGLQKVRSGQPVTAVPAPPAPTAATD